MLQAHTTKRGPGQMHVEGTSRNGKRRPAKSKLPHSFAGAKTLRKALLGQLTIRH